MQGVQPEDRSVGDLFSQLSDGLSRLIHQEIQLARTEMAQKISKARQGATLLAAGGALLYAGLLVLLGALVLILANFVAPWIAALIVGVAVCLVGYLLVQQGASKLQDTDLTPHRTLETIKENAEWVKQQTG